jgi:tRNA(Ile)-lysidine synthase
VSPAAGTAPPALALRFARHPNGAGLLQGRSRLLVALSGGLDSVCLLHLLRFGRFEFVLHAAHFDHAMRADSAADAAWVRGLCSAWGVPLEQARATPPPAGEAAAREGRYAFLQDAAARAGADAILTAHHADDQAETVLFRLARGTGLRGVAGIPARRGLLLRPLLPFTRRELEQYATAAGIAWRDDPSNRELRYARNRIRHTVLPALEAVRPGAARRIGRLARLAAEAEHAWDAIVQDVLRTVATARPDGGFVLARERLLAYHPHVRARVLRRLLHELGSAPGRAGTRSAAEFISSGTSGGGLALPGGVRLERELDRLLLVRVGREPHVAEADTSLVIPGPEAGAGRLELAGQPRLVRWGAEPPEDGGDASASFDPSALRFPLVVRGWLPGDRIRLAYGSKKLKKLFLEQRVERARRGTVPVLCDATGEVLWVVGMARSCAALPADGDGFTVTVSDGDSF